MKNRGLLIIIAVILIGILGVLLVNVNGKESSIGDSINEAAEEIADEIDDNTTGN